MIGGGALGCGFGPWAGGACAKAELANAAIMAAVIMSDFMPVPPPVSSTDA